MSREHPAVDIREADRSETGLLAAMNARLIRAEGADNPMSEPELAERIAGYLDAGYNALIFIVDGKPAGYALYRIEASGVFLHHFFVEQRLRRRRIGTEVMRRLLESRWESAPMVTLEVRAANETGVAFWRHLGFDSHSIRMRLDRRDAALSDRACGAVVYRRRLGGVHYLLIRQHDGHWGFPKGHIDDGESERETAVREIREETGLPVTLRDDFREMITYRLPSGRQKWVTYFLGRARAFSTPKRQQKEIAELAWLPYDEARRRVSFENARAVLDRAERRIRGAGA